MVAEDGVFWHAALQSLVGILYHSHTAAFGDVDKARGAVLEQSGQHHTHHPITIHGRRRAKQGVDTGTVAPFLRRGQHAHDIFFDGQLVVGDGDVHPAMLELLPIDGIGDRQRGETREQAREDAGPALADMHGDKHRRIEIFGQAAQQPFQGFQAAGRRTNDDEVAEMTRVLHGVEANQRSDRSPMLKEKDWTKFAYSAPLYSVSKRTRNIHPSHGAARIANTRVNKRPQARFLERAAPRWFASAICPTAGCDQQPRKATQTNHKAIIAAIISKFREQMEGVGWVSRRSALNTVNVYIKSGLQPLSRCG